MELVKPEVPNAQSNRSPELLLEGLRTGLAAFAQFAQIRRQQESDVAHLALQERLAQEQHGIEQHKLDQAARLIPSQIAANEAHAEMMTNQAKAYNEGYGNAAQRKIVEDQQAASFLEDFNNDAVKLKLNDPAFEAKDPAQYYINLNEQLYRKYGTSTMPEVKKSLDYYRSRADSHKIPLPNVTYDTDGTPVVANGAAPMVVVGQIVEDLRSPESHGVTYDRLKAAGYIKPGEKESSGSGWFGFGKHAATPDTPNPVAKWLIDKSQQPIGGGTDASKTTTGYIPGRTYGGKKFLGGDPNDPNNWR